MRIGAEDVVLYMQEESGDSHRCLGAEMANRRQISRLVSDRKVCVRARLQDAVIRTEKEQFRAR